MIAEASPRLTPWSGILYTLVTFIACYFHRRTCFMSQETSPQNEAVFLFSGDAIDREMLYPEFEAILDGFVPMPENAGGTAKAVYVRSEEHTSELQSRGHLVCRLLLEKKTLSDD